MDWLACQVGVKFVGGSIGIGRMKEGKVIVRGGANAKIFTDFFADSGVVERNRVDHAFDQGIHFGIPWVGKDHFGHSDKGEFIDRVIKIGPHGERQKITGNFLGTFLSFTVNTCVPGGVSPARKAFQVEFASDGDEERGELFVTGK